MKFSGKMWLKNTFLKKTQGVGGGGQIDPPSVFRVKEDRYLNKVIHQITRYGVLASLKDVLRYKRVDFWLNTESYFVVEVPSNYQS